MTTVGFVGLGNIGRPMAERLRDARIDLVVLESRREVALDFAGSPERVAASPRELGDRADIVLMSLPTPAALRAVVGGDDGLARGKRVKLVVDLSTVGPATARESAALLQTVGIGFLDAPVSGGVAGAKKGTLAVMAAGAAADYERARPLLEYIGRVFLVGDTPGQGQAMKLLNNLLSANAVAATAEVMALGAKAGLDGAVMLDVLNASSGRNMATADKFPRAVLTRTFELGFRTVLLHKDVRLCREFAREYGVPFTVGAAVDQVWEQAAAELGDADFMRIVERIEQQAGAKIEARAGAPAAKD